MKSFNQYFKEMIQEGVNDPGIFKAFFTAGGPGSGKSYVASRAGMGSVSPYGLKIIDSDPLFKHLLKQADMTATEKDIWSKKGQETRERAKALTKRRQAGYLEGRLGLLIDGTGKDYGKIKKMSDALRKVGYDTYMLFVNTSLDVAIQRDAARDRTLGPAEVEKMWKPVQANMGKFQSYFGRENFILIDNNNANDKLFDMLFVQIGKLINEPPSSRAASAWIKSQRSR